MMIKCNNTIVRSNGLVFVTVTGFTYVCAIAIAEKLAKNAGIDVKEVNVLAGPPNILIHKFRVTEW